MQRLFRINLLNYDMMIMLSSFIMEIEKGFLYIIDEPITVDHDICHHPGRTIDKNAEFLTKRPLKVKLIKNCNIDYIC